MKRITVSLAMSLIMGLASNARAGDCSNKTLQGTYAFRSEANPTTGGKRLNLALIAFHGDGTYTNLGFTVNTNGVISTGTLTALYSINADCSGVLLNPDGSEQGPVIVHEDGSEFYFLRTNPSTLMLVGTGTRVSRGHEDKTDTDGGATSSQIGLPGNSSSIPSVRIRSNVNTLYAGTVDNGVFVSHDHGTTGASEAGPIRVAGRC
jgi:hypothetical protein